MQVGLVRRDNTVVAVQNRANFVLEREKIRSKTTLAYNLFVSTTPDNETSATLFKEQYCHTVEIEFLGVW